MAIVVAKTDQLDDPFCLQTYCAVHTVMIYIYTFIYHIPVTPGALPRHCMWLLLSIED